MSRITLERNNSSGCFQLQSHGKVPTCILSSMYNNDKSLSDVSLIGAAPKGGACNLQPIRAHKNILAHASPHLFDLFTVQGYVDSNKSAYTITNIDHNSLCSIIKFIYTDNVEVEENDATERVRGILIGAKYLIMKELADACESFLASSDRIDVNNCIDVFQFAFKYNCINLLSVVYAFIAKNLLAVSQSTKFLALTQDECAKFLLSEPVVAANADDRCQAAIAWLNHESPSRAVSAECIMSMVDLKAAGIMPGTLLLAARSAVILPTTKGFALNVIDAMASSIQRTSQKESEKEKEQKPEDAQREAWYIVGSENDRKAFYRYDVAGRRWWTLPELPWERHCAGVCAIGKRLIVMGGYKNNRCVASIDEYNTAAQTWSTSKAELSGARTSFAATADNTYVYAFGGRGSDYKPLDVVDRYCAEVGVIERLPSIERKGYYATAACKEDNVAFVVGGLSQSATGDGVWYHNTVVKYDHTKKQQDAIITSTQNRRSPGIAFLGDELYIAGGCDSTQVEIFNTQTGRIRFCAAEMGHARAGCSAVPLDHNVLCVLGGQSDDTWEYSRSVETFDAREGKWTVGVIPDMPKGCAYFGFAHVHA